MAVERYLSRRIPNSSVGNDIDKMDKKPIQVILRSMLRQGVQIWNFEEKNKTKQKKNQEKFFGCVFN